MKTVQFREAICEAMSEEMRRDESIYLMGEEVAEYNGAYKASKGMLEEFGELRVIDTPISEAGFSGVGVGATMVGARPIIEFMTFNFALVGIDQIINNAVFPSKVHNILFTRTGNGMFYGPHIDLPHIPSGRRDLSFTIFLNEKKNYKGGE